MSQINLYATYELPNLPVQYPVVYELPGMPLVVPANIDLHSTFIVRPYPMTFNAGLYTTQEMPQPVQPPVEQEDAGWVTVAHDDDDWEVV